jgi:hypothetical protein
VVRIHPVQLADVQGEAAVVGHGYEELLHQLGVIAADLLGRDLQPIAQVRTATAIERHLHQRLIQRCHEMAEAVDAAPIAQGLGEGLAHGDAHILIGVVVVDMGVARGLDLQVDQPMAADLVEHVVEKRHPGAHLAAPAAIEAQGHTYVGFAGDAVDLTDAGGCGHDQKARHVQESWRTARQNPANRPSGNKRDPRSAKRITQIEQSISEAKIKI